MGRLKALLPWRGATLLEYTIGELRAAAVDDLVVVLGHAADELAPIARRAGVRTVHNPRYAEGRATSIAAGATAVEPGCEAVLVASVDQPRPREAIAALLAAHRRAEWPISRLVHGEQHGHPTVFSCALFDELRGVAEESEGMKSILRRHAESIQDVEYGDPIVLLNLNTPEEYERARALFGS